MLLCLNAVTNAPAQRHSKFPSPLKHIQSTACLRYMGLLQHTVYEGHLQSAFSLAGWRGIQQTCCHAKRALLNGEER